MHNYYLGKCFKFEDANIFLSKVIAKNKLWKYTFPYIKYIE